MSLPSPRNTPAGASSRPAGAKPVIVSAEADEDARAAAAAIAAESRELADAFEAELSNVLCELGAVAEKPANTTGSIGRVRVGGFAYAVVYAVESKRVVVAAVVRVRPKASRGAS